MIIINRLRYITCGTTRPGGRVFVGVMDMGEDMGTNFYWASNGTGFCGGGICGRLIEGGVTLVGTELGFSLGEMVEMRSSAVGLN